MLVVALLSIVAQDFALGSRINVKAHHDLVEAAQRESTRGGDDTAWTLSFSGIPCYQSDELEQLGPFAAGIQGSWNSKNLFGTILTESRKIASVGNCKLCNLEVKGSVLPQQVGSLKPHVASTVECAAEAEKLSIGCYTANGNLGKFHSPSPYGICTPCPEECDGGCTVPGTTDFTTSSSTWFKCITADPKKIASAAVRAESTKVVNIKSGYDCEASKFSSLAADAQEVLSAGDSDTDSKAYKDSYKPKFFKSKSREGQWNLWCKYKGNYALGVEEAVRSPLVADKSTWHFDAGITGCSNVREMGGDGFVAKLAQAASGLLTVQAETQNCNICDSSFGGLMATMLAKADAVDLSEVLQDLTDKDPKGDESLWMKAECAYKLLGTAACNLGKGSVGWAETAPCLPCPEECTSCIPDKKGSFKCALKPIVSFPSPALASMTGDTSEKLAGDLYKLPEGLECSTPENRRCTRTKKGEWCKAWQFKTVCKYGKLGNPNAK